MHGERRRAGRRAALWSVPLVAAVVAVPAVVIGASSDTGGSSAPVAVTASSPAGLEPIAVPGADLTTLSDLEATSATTEPGASAAPKKKLGQVLAGDTVLREGDAGLAIHFLQQRLLAAGIAVAETDTYDAATAAGVSHLQEKFALTGTGRVNRYTLQKLLEITDRGPSLPTECMTGTVICIDKTARVLRLVRDGAVEQTLDARFGTFGASTREGLFTLYDKKEDDFSQLFGVPMRYSMYFDGGQAVHYSATFARDGYQGNSAGCVNTRDLEATQALFSAVATGDAVYIYR